jgi:hypothetical protein
MIRILLMRGYFFAKSLNSILASPNGCETWWSRSWCSYEAVEYLTCSFEHIWEALVASFQNLSLDWCISKRGRNVGGEKCIASLKPIPIVKGELVHCFCIFWLLGWPSAKFNRSNRFGGTGLTGWGNRSDRFVPSVGTCSVGVCICVRGALVCFGGLCSLLELVFDSVVSSCCPCLWGLSLSSFKWPCSLPLFGFRSLVWVSFSRFFSFPFLSSYQKSVLSMHSSRGRLRTMCGSRTGGWSLPGVMSDWQRCVDWFLVKYCRCRLQLDWCWCRWRTSAKRHSRWGL